MSKRPRGSFIIPPNTALQRTRSAPLRSPLSFETLGDAGKGEIDAFVHCVGTAATGARTASRKGPNYDRLAQVKRKDDPDNLFRMNQNIEPA